MKTIWISLWFAISFLTVSCDDSKPKPLGAACTEKTVCDGVCNLALPDGMCTYECSETEPCARGKCVRFEEHSYCLPDCSTNGDCRAGYACIDFFCAPLQPVGARCDDNADCLPCAGQENCPPGSSLECRENVCAIPCRDQSDCVSGTMCAYSLDGFWCVGVDYETGPGTVGADCNLEPCQEGLDCAAFVSPDGLSKICTRFCENDRECPPWMACRPDTDGSTRCHPRTYCEPCALDSSCGAQGDLCVGVNPDAEKYCSRECDPALPGTCPTDTVCAEVRRCESKNAWVTDCAGCAGCESSPARYQCIPWQGSCIGAGDSCTGCFVDEQCGEGLSCVLGPDTWQSVCALPCPAAKEACPDGTWCRTTERGDFCLPRTGSCQNPSGGRDACAVCTRHTDCLRGFCAQVPGDTSGFKYCLDLPENDACGPYARTADVNVLDFGTQTLCVPETAVGTCDHYLECLNLCPDGPANCTSGPAYCQ